MDFGATHGPALVGKFFRIHCLFKMLCRASICHKVTVYYLRPVPERGATTTG
jgi:hypothetical protein